MAIAFIWRFPETNSSIQYLTGLGLQIGSMIKYSEYNMFYYNMLHFETRNMLVQVVYISSQKYTGP
jgi:hypothetical protein